MISDSTKDLLKSVAEQLYSESTVAKVYGVSTRLCSNSTPPTDMPEYSFDKYVCRPMEWWTCGYFPGSIYCILERQRNHPKFFPLEKIHPVRLEYQAKWVTEAIYDQVTRTDTHDIGFIVMPSLEREYLLNKSKRALEGIKQAADALASRFDETVGCIRSWDTAVNKRYQFTDPTVDFIVIIDNMCNLNLLYCASELTGDLRYSTIATSHAETTLKNHFRFPEWSSHHLVNYNRTNGSVKAKFTNQGYDDQSTWTRGQAWAVLGFSETYKYTKQEKFREAASNLADYFISRLPEDGVTPWDFDAPDQEIKDSSAAMITALGLVTLYETTKVETYLAKALKIVKDTIAFAYSGSATLNQDGSVEFGEIDAILKFATRNNNPDTYDRLVNHGLVYGDYYFLCIGNKLLDLGLIDLLK